jgi:hypothetical protein
LSDIFAFFPFLPFLVVAMLFLCAGSGGRPSGLTGDSEVPD